MSQRNLSLWIACGIVLCLQLVPGIDAFQFRVPNNDSVGTKTRMRTYASSATTTMDFLPIASIGTEALTIRKSTRLFDKQPDDNNDETVEVGTKEYYSGFLASPIQDETVAERGSGLEQALKLAGGVVVLLVVLVAGFLASNDLL